MIFIGRVINKVPPIFFGNVKYTMKVEEAFKGTSVGANVTVRARENKTSCGLGTISVDDRWQIWLNENGTTNSCTRTTSDFNKNWEELELLAHKSL